MALTYPFAVPKIRTWYILEGNLLVVDHQSSLCRQGQMPSPSTPENWRDRKAHSSSSPVAETSDRGAYSLAKGNDCLSHRRGQCGRASLSFGSGHGHRGTSLRPWLLGAGALSSVRPSLRLQASSQALAESQHVPHLAGELAHTQGANSSFCSRDTLSTIFLSTADSDLLGEATGLTTGS